MTTEQLPTKDALLAALARGAYYPQQVIDQVLGTAPSPPGGTPISDDEQQQPSAKPGKWVTKADEHGATVDCSVANCNTPAGKPCFTLGGWKNHPQRNVKAAKEGQQKA